MNTNKEALVEILKENSCKKAFDNMGIVTVILFGSILTDDFEEHSDIDIAILSYKSIDINNILSLEEFLEKKLNREIDIIDLRNRNTEMSIKVTIYDEGEIIYNNDNLELYNNEYKQTERTYKDNETFRFFR